MTERDLIEKHVALLQGAVEFGNRLIDEKTRLVQENKALQAHFERASANYQRILHEKEDLMDLLDKKDAEIDELKAQISGHLCL